MKNKFILRLMLFQFILLLSSLNVSFAERTILNLQQNSISAVTPGLSVEYFTRKTISGVVKKQDGEVVETSFYVQDISVNPPVLVATHKTDANGHYSFELDLGLWRVVPVSSSFKFEPRAREYDTRLNSTVQ